MNSWVRQTGTWGLCLAMLFLAATEAHAFFPSGGFDALGLLRLAKWRLADFDTNNDGVVTDGEGLPLLFEGGPRGFTQSEIDQVFAGLKVWGNVPEAYADFRFAGVVEDPIQAGTATDYLPTVALQVTGADAFVEGVEADAALVGDLGGLVAVTVTLFSIDDTIVDGPGQDQVVVAAGTILDSDIIFSAADFRPSSNGVLPTFELTPVAANMGGLMLGLAQTPLNNLQATGDVYTATGLTIETEPLWFTKPDGTREFIGVTPTMHNRYFLTEDVETGQLQPGLTDLAPDDISGISWLYPREGQNEFFRVDSEARTFTRTGSGFPSLPILGGHVVAWGDTDNNPVTPRVPVFSTMTGLYKQAQFVTPDEEKEVGEFSLLGIWKQFEVPLSQGDFYDATYTLTLSPFNSAGFDRQAPPGDTPEVVDSLQGTTTASYSPTSRGAGEYDTLFLSQVFQEDENVFDVDNFDAGTPLRWDVASQQVVSVDTGRSLSRILGDDPMFGDPNDVCLFNVLTEGTATTDTGDTGTGDTDGADLLAGKVRDFRDGFLLESAPGSALVGMYYEWSPWMAKYVLKHDWAYRGWLAAGELFAWMVRNWVWITGFALLALFLRKLLSLLRGKRRRASAAGLLLLAGLLLPAFNAQGIQLDYSTEDLVASSSDIVAGRVVALNSRWQNERWIVTDVTLEIGEVVKGRMNKASNITFTVTGGRIGGLVMAASGLAKFQEGEDVILYMVDSPNGGKTVFAGEQGKVTVRPASEEEESAEGEATAEGEVPSAEQPDSEAANDEHTESSEGETVEPSEDTPESGPLEGETPSQDAAGDEVEEEDPATGDEDIQSGGGGFPGYDAGVAVLSYRAKSGQPALMPVGEYLDLLRNIVREQRNSR